MRLRSRRGGDAAMGESTIPVVRLPSPLPSQQVAPDSRYLETSLPILTCTAPTSNVPTCRARSRSPNAVFRDGTSVGGKRAIVGKASAAAGPVGFRGLDPTSAFPSIGRGEGGSGAGAGVLEEEASTPAGEGEGAERWRSAQAKEA